MRCGLPDTLEMKPSTSKQREMWTTFGKNFMPLAIVDRSSDRPDRPLQGKAKFLTRKVSWVSVDGSQTSAHELTAKPEKDNLFWFRDVLVHVPGTITVEYFANDDETIEGIKNIYDVEPVEGMDDVSSELTSKTLTRAQALHRNLGNNNKLAGKALGLVFDDVLNKIFFDDYVAANTGHPPKGGRRKKKDRSWQVPKPTVSQILLMAAKRLEETKDAVASDDDLEEIKAAFEVVFESKLLYEDERAAFGKALERAHKVECTPYADVCGAPHLLRLLVLMNQLGGVGAEQIVETEPVAKKRRAESESFTEDRIQEAVGAILAIIREITDEV